MEFLLVSLGILGVLVVAAGVIDLRARRTRKRLSVDHGDVRDHRRRVLGESSRHDGGRIDQPGGGLF